MRMQIAVVVVALTTAPTAVLAQSSPDQDLTDEAIAEALAAAQSVNVGDGADDPVQRVARAAYVAAVLAYVYTTALAAHAAGNGVLDGARAEYEATSLLLAFSAEKRAELLAVIEESRNLLDELKRLEPTQNDR